MNNKIILIQPASLELRDEKLKERYSMPPIGLLSIASFLRAHGYEVILFDFFRNHNVTRKKFEEQLLSIKETPLLVGLSTYTDLMEDSYKIIKVVKKMFPSTTIVLGGPHATFCYNEILTKSPVRDIIDFIILNEGERCIIELLEYIKYPIESNLSTIGGLIINKKDDHFEANTQVEYISLLDTLPFPAYDLSTTDDQEKKLSARAYQDEAFILMSSRGCPGNCTFCASRAMSGAKYRMNSAEWLISLILFERLENNFKVMGVMDDTFLVNKKRLTKLCSYLNELNIVTCPQSMYQ